MSTETYMMHFELDSASPNSLSLNGKKVDMMFFKNSPFEDRKSVIQVWNNTRVSNV